ncbi:MAG: VanZ family protein [Bacteroidaceae bacterium]|nr:VanZ family protein [Bacteroidaceae bacterium]
MFKLKGRIIAFIILLGYVALVCYMCLANFNNVNSSWLPDTLFGFKIDKCIHFCLFFPVPILFFITFHGKRVIHSAIFSIICCIAAGTAIEFSQKLTAYRTFDVYDLYANYLAILSGTVIISVVFAIRNMCLQIHDKKIKH